MTVRPAGATSWTPRTPDRARSVHRYSVYGGVLCSELPFPEISTTATGSPEWTLSVAGGGGGAEERELLGQRSIGAERYELWRSTRGLRLDYSHAGSFEISHDATEFVYRPTADASPELARWIVLGPVLALALESRGHLCLHGSAVSIDGRAVVFVGPKHYGKSTLAASLLAAGACLIADDTVAISPGGAPSVRPGLASVRLWQDSASAVRVRELCDSVREGVKTLATGFPSRSVRSERTALAAVYVLEPSDPAVEHSCARAPLPPSAAAAALAQHAKVPDPLVGRRAAASRLLTAASVASAIPVFSLRVARDFGVLPLVARRIITWHADDATRFPLERG